MQTFCHSFWHLCCTIKDLRESLKRHIEDGYDRVGSGRVAGESSEGRGG